METKEDSASVGNWRDMNNQLANCTEEEAQALLNAELEGKRRPGWLLRIYGKFATLRAERERAELFAKKRGK